MSISRLLRNIKVWLSVALLIVSIIGTIIGVFGLYPSKAPAVMRQVLDKVGDWYLWGLIGGPIGVLGFGWYVGDYFKKLKEFRELLNTNSKAKFLREIDRAEELAWHLGDRYIRRFEEKLAELGIRR